MVILEVVRAQPDATFVELLVVLKKRGIRTSRSALWRQPSRHHLQEEEPLRQRTAAPGCGAGPPQMDSRARPYEQRRWSRPHPVELLARVARVLDTVRSAMSSGRR